MNIKLAENKSELKSFMVMKMTDVVISFQFDHEEEARIKARELTKQGNGQFVVYELKAHYEKRNVEVLTVSDRL